MNRHISVRRAYCECRRKKLIRQKLIGVCLLVLCALCVAVAMNGDTPEERDCTAVFIVAPMAVWLILSDNVAIY